MEISQQMVKQWETALREEDKLHWKGAVLGWGGSTSTSLRTFNIFTESLDIKKKQQQQTNKPTGVLWNMTDMWWNLSTVDSWRVLLVHKNLRISQAEISQTWNYTNTVK